MTGYKIYLTRSSEVATLIAEASRKEMVGGQAASIGHGVLHSSNVIPKIYQEMGYYYCAVEYRDLDVPVYEIIFA